MKLSYHPKSELEQFGQKIYFLLVENFSQTFYVGGMVRDLLLGRKVTDIDIATQATPDQVADALSRGNISTDATNKKFGSVLAKRGSLCVEITSFRKDLKSTNRYPKVLFINSAKIDSKRRDFTINSLYLSQKQQEILDPQKGIADLKAKKIRFIGQPSKRILEDPLRAIRALRFALQLNFSLEAKTKKALINNFSMTKTLTKTKIEKEILKLKSPSKRKILKMIIGKPKILDKTFK